MSTIIDIVRMKWLIVVESCYVTLDAPHEETKPVFVTIGRVSQKGGSFQQREGCM